MTALRLITVSYTHLDVYKRQEYLYEKVWKTSTAGDTQALKTAVARLRNKIRESGFCIVSARGEGYCLEQE